MSTPDAATERLLHYYDAVGRWLASAVARLTDDVDIVLEAGRDRFARMLTAGEIPYLDRTDHTMAGSMFACAAMLAVHEALAERGFDAHAWGREIQKLPAEPQTSADEEVRSHALERSRREAADAQRNAPANEFVWDVVEGDDSASAGMNITSCAICHLFAKHDAMALVPYMCAFDDAMSAAGDRGLRRTGTIALGATHCDFRFAPGGKPLTLASQYPGQIRLDDASE